MSAHKHTPGPWYVGPEFGANQMRPSIRIYRDVTYVEGCRPTTYVIGEVGYPTTTGNTVGAEERLANARLIAAAPELLEALITKVKDAEQRSFEDWLEFNSPSGDHEAVQRQWLASNDYRGFIGEWREQLDAIAKATGEPA